MTAYIGKYKDELIANAARFGAPGKGADESTGTIGKLLASINVENVEETHRALRELLFCTPGALQYLGGVILFEETHYQKTASTNGETAAQGHDDLGKLCAKYYLAGARFAKWRAVLKISPNEPSQLDINENANGLARYAIICQENGLVPIVEAEILVDGQHDFDRCAEVSELVLAACYKALNDHHVLLEGTLLKLNLVTTDLASPEVIAGHMVLTLLMTLPAGAPAFVILSVWQREEEAALNLNAMNKLKGKNPWSLSYSFGQGKKRMW